MGLNARCVSSLYTERQPDVCECVLGSCKQASAEGLQYMCCYIIAIFIYTATVFTKLLKCNFITMRCTGLYSSGFFCIVTFLFVATNTCLYTCQKHTWVKQYSPIHCVFLLLFFKSYTSAITVGFATSDSTIGTDTQTLGTCLKVHFVKFPFYLTLSYLHLRTCHCSHQELSETTI